LIVLDARMDEPLGCLIWLLWLPHELWKLMNEGTRLGPSKMDHEAGRFWEGFAIIGTAIAVGGIIAWLIWAWLFKS
jgi:hypothetical protein